LSGLAAILMGIHVGIANLTEHQHWRLDQEEANALADAAGKVARHFDIFGKSALALDISLAVGAVVSVYGPRIAVSAMKGKTSDVQQ